MDEDHPDVGIKFGFVLGFVGMSVFSPVSVSINVHVALLKRPFGDQMP